MELFDLTHIRTKYLHSNTKLSTAIKHICESYKKWVNLDDLEKNRLAHMAVNYFVKAGEIAIVIIDQTRYISLCVNTHAHAAYNQNPPILSHILAKPFYIYSARSCVPRHFIKDKIMDSAIMKRKMIRNILNSITYGLKASCLHRIVLERLPAHLHTNIISHIQDVTRVMINSGELCKHGRYYVPIK
jgi:hypothetical protein